jgi:hypothetical protein
MKQSENLKTVRVGNQWMQVYCPKTMDDSTIKGIVKDLVAIPMILFLAWGICFVLDLIINGVPK